MRYNIELTLSNDNIPKDKNRIIISFLKHIYESYDKEYYKSLYKEAPNKMKNFTFAVYMPNCSRTTETGTLSYKFIYRWQYCQ